MSILFVIDDNHTRVDTYAADLSSLHSFILWFFFLCRRSYMQGLGMQIKLHFASKIYMLHKILEEPLIQESFESVPSRLLRWRRCLSVKMLPVI